MKIILRSTACRYMQVYKKQTSAHNDGFNQHKFQGLLPVNLNVLRSSVLINTNVILTSKYDSHQPKWDSDEHKFHQTKMPAWSNNEHQPSCFGAELRLSWEVKSDLKIPMNENPYEWENLCNLYLPRRQRKLIPSDPPPPSNASMGKLETPSNAMHGYTRHPLI